MPLPRNHKNPKKRHTNKNIGVSIQLYHQYIQFSQFRRVINQKNRNNSICFEQTSFDSNLYVNFMVLWCNHLLKVYYSNKTKNINRNQMLKTTKPLVSTLFTWALQKWQYTVKLELWSEYELWVFFFFCLFHLHSL